MAEEYYKTKESVNEYIELAKDVDRGDLIEQLKQYVKAGSDVLEIGSGPGTDWEILSRDFNVTGSDFSQDFLNHLKKTYPKGRFVELDAVSLQTDEKFDVIYSNKVMHHLTDDDLLQSVERQSKMLHDDGVVCHSFWKGEGSEMFKGMNVNYHNLDELKSMFASKFKVLLVEDYKEFEDNDSIVLIAKIL